MTTTTKPRNTLPFWPGQDGAIDKTGPVPAADLEPGDVFVDPSTGLHVTFDLWDHDEDGPFVIGRLAHGGIFAVGIDQSTFVTVVAS